MNLEAKILKAIQTKNLNPEITGGRKWYDFFINVTELVWARNNHDGYKIEVFDKQYGEHLATITI